MSAPFMSSEEYDERAHTLYNDARYDEALAVLREGLTLYPHAVELHIGVGYARLAREEFAWARRSFEEALVLDGDHEDALADGRHGHRAALGHPDQDPVRPLPGDVHRGHLGQRRDPVPDRGQVGAGQRLAGRDRGRVQHLRTEDAIHFDSLAELARFISLHAEDAPRVTPAGA